jgi:hypothetical protein
MDHSKSHDDSEIQEKVDRKDLIRCPHPPCSLDLSPCDFCFFGMAKEKMKDCEFRTVQDILRGLLEIWNDLIFEDAQSVFRKSHIRLNWVIKNSGEYCFEYTEKNGNLPNQYPQNILSARGFRHSVLN